MEMSIDDARTELISGNPFTNKFARALVVAIDTIRKYQMMQADYENRLKADMVAMLEEISLKFDEQYYVNRHELHDDSLNVGLEQGQSIIQQKIDALKGNTDGC